MNRGTAANNNRSIYAIQPADPTLDKRDDDSPQGTTVQKR
jgi:hypothetical protein